MVMDPEAIPGAPRSVVTVLEQILVELKRIADALEALAQPHPPSPPQQQQQREQPKQHETPRSLSQVTVPIVKDLFNDKQRDLLVFSDEVLADAEIVKVKPKEFLPPETFREIAKIVQDHGGEYISAGKESHFRFLKKGST